MEDAHSYEATLALAAAPFTTTDLDSLPTLWDLIKGDWTA